MVEKDIAQDNIQETTRHDLNINNKRQSQDLTSPLSLHYEMHYSNLKQVESTLTDEQKRDLEVLKLHRQLCNFLSVTQIYLDKNVLLKRALKTEDIKLRLLGHFGTCPGINLVYSHCNYLIKKHEDLEMFLVVGPGHGAPALVANLYVEGSLQHYYPQYSLDEKGVTTLSRDFSRHGGFPSHTNPMLPGTIHEGGELGYALGVSYGAVLNNPDLIVTCIVGDGECETGPTATAWHAHKFIDPKESGAVIPIVHLNGFKISSPTLYGTMSDKNLIHLFIGYGYQPRIVGNDLDRIDLDMSDAMEWALSEIRKIQKAAREGHPIFKPRFPVIIMKTPKGWTGIKQLHGLQIEGTFRSHQVPAPNVRTDKEEFQKLEEWLRSYNINELFDENGRVRQEILDMCPKGHRRMGCNKYAMPKFAPLNPPDIWKYAVEVGSDDRGKNALSATQQAGKYLAELWELNKDRFKIFSPDELESNKLHAILKVSNRNYQWNEETAHKGGGVIEILSEHTCQAMMQGYTLTGRYGLFPSYEAFLGIVQTMMTQYAKFMKISKEVVFRNPLPAFTYIESSTLWRQEHNGFSHQNPGFINILMNMKSDLVRIYLPPDANTLVSTMNHCMKSKDYINLIVSSKNETSNWLSMKEAVEHCRAGASVWKWAGSEDTIGEPDVVLVGIGNEVTTEVVAAAQLLKKFVPAMKVRVVNITDLMILEQAGKHPHGLTDTMFNALFTTDKPVVINFHGYPSAVQQLLFGRKHVARFSIHGYMEEGTTTTPFHMLSANEASRFHLCIDAVKAVTPNLPAVAIDAPTLIADFQHKLREHNEYILQYNADPQELSQVMNPEAYYCKDK
jgi:xylulose-5-phosphate/fructose-6-phosphate phosphoketolase